MELLLFGALGLLLVFMIFNTRRRTRQMKAEQEEKRTQTLPGAKVLLQGGLFGTIVSYDAEDLDAPAQVELAPGVVVEVHSQAVLRIVEPVDAPEEYDADIADVEEEAVSDIPASIETTDETRARLERDADDK